MTVRRMYRSKMEDAGPEGLPVLVGNAYYIYAAGTHAPATLTTATLALQGVEAGDLVFTTLAIRPGSAQRTILTAKCTKNLVTFVMSGATGAGDHTINWMVLKPLTRTSGARRKY